MNTATAKHTVYTIIFTADRDLSQREVVLSTMSWVSKMDQMGDDWYRVNLSFTEGYTDFNVETSKRIIKTNFSEYSNINPVFAITENGEQINIPKS